MLEITEVLGFEDDRIVLKPMYQFEETGRMAGTLRKKGELTYVEKLQYVGLR